MAIELIAIRGFFKPLFLNKMFHTSKKFYNNIKQARKQ